MDSELQGNDKIETAIEALQNEPTEEMLAHTLTVIRRRMKEKGAMILAVEPPSGDGKIRIKAVKMENGQQWWTAFTGFDEELKGADSIKSTFLADIEQIFISALQQDTISGVIINPWNRTLMLDKNLIKIIMGC